MKQVREDLSDDLARVNADLLAIKLEVAELRADIADDLRDLSLQRLTTTMVATMLGGIFGAASLAFAAAKLA